MIIQNEPSAANILKSISLYQTQTTMPYFILNNKVKDNENNQQPIIEKEKKDE